jgi:hypothetical protein
MRYIRPIIGIDLDNTIAIYDKLIRNQANLLNVPFKFKSKKEIADYLRDIDSEEEWTKLQGLIYGPLMEYAEVADGFLDTLKKLIDDNFDIIIISHRTQYSQYDGLYNLHYFANKWIEKNIISKIGKNKIKNIIFAETIDSKVNYISIENITYFIDDLPKVLNHINFPKTAKKILYSNEKVSENYFLQSNNWIELINFITK